MSNDFAVDMTKRTLHYILPLASASCCCCLAFATRHADSGHTREFQAPPSSKPRRLGRSEQMGRLPRSRPMVDTAKEATLPGKSGRKSGRKSERFRYLNSAVQAAAAQVESFQDQVQGMPRVAERTVRRRAGAVRLQRREATWEVLNLRACKDCSHKCDTECIEETQA